MDIGKYAKLARIAITPNEEKKLKKDIESILHYVDQIGEVDVSKYKKGEGLHNVMREDILKESGESAEEIIKEMPKREGRYLKVKKIL